MFSDRLRAMSILGCFVFCLSWGALSYGQEQMADPEFQAVVDAPAYPEGGPTVAIDEGHANFHTATGQYRPFAELLRSDGYHVIGSASAFEADALDDIDILVIANALPAGLSDASDLSDLSKSAFTEQECDVVRDWVRAGGALLLIADHTPFGGCAERLASRFGVSMGKGWVFERVDSGRITTQLIFSRENGLLGMHPILSGRTAEEEVHLVKTFTGQSLGVPDSATALLSFGPSAREAATHEDLNAVAEALRNEEAMPERIDSLSTSVAGRAQGIAMPFGNGRIVVLGEAGFLTAQLVRFEDGREMRFGLNVPGYDDQQFALNVLHWLSRLQ
jgi:hypothetical protein